MDVYFLKLECLRIASGQGLRGEEAAKFAREMFDWVSGAKPGEKAKVAPKTKRKPSR